CQRFNRALWSAATMNSLAAQLEFLLLIIIVLAFLASAVASPSVRQVATMRLDYFHTGNTSEEVFSLDRIVIEPLPWPGNPNRPVDVTNRGAYLFEVRDLGSGRVLYSRGFSSIYGEWITTAEAKTVSRTFHESLRFP